MSVPAWAALITAAGLLGFVAIFFFSRWFNDVMTARSFGWSAASAVYATDAASDSGWTSLQKVYWSKSLGKMLERWGWYYHVKFQATDSGLAVRYSGRWRPRSEPVNHPTLLFPWEDIDPGQHFAKRRKGRPANRVIIAPSAVPGVGISVSAADAGRIATASRGRWSILPPTDG